MTVAELYPALAPMLVGWLVNRVRDRELAEDLAGDAWERCWRAERRGQTVKAGYVYAAAHSAMVDHIRRANFVQWIALSPYFDPPAPPDSEDEELEIDELLSERFCWLSERQREIVRLRALGYRWCELVTRYGLTRNSLVKVQGRAREKARMRRIA